MSSKEQKPAAIKFWSPLRIVSTVIVLGMLAAFGASSCNSNDPPPAPTPSPQVTVSQPKRPEPLASLPQPILNVEMKGANGQSIKLSNYPGKVLLVNLWATWCGPCRTETPELVKLHKEYQNRGVAMIGLSTEDPVSSAPLVQNFIRQYNVNYPIGWATREVAATLMQGVNSIPQSFVITRDGRIKKRFIGFHPTRTPPQLKQAIEDALIDNG